MSSRNIKRKNKRPCLTGSRTEVRRTDIKYVNRTILYLPIISALVASSLSADPLKNYDSAINDYTSKDSSFFTDREERKIKQLFSQSPDEWEADKYSAVSYHKDKSNIELPAFININPIISSKIVHQSGIIIKSYIVKPKDTLFRIAKTLKTTAARITEANGLQKGSVLKVGQSLSVPIKVANATRQKIEHRRVFLTPVVNSRITSRYGRRKDPFHTGSGGYHTGIDLAGPQGAPILASAEGTISFAGVNGGYGNTVIVDHGNGYKTMYAHCAKITVEQGTKVRAGTVIGGVGRTGSATGSHLHFEVFLNGTRINPEIALRKTLKIVTNLETGKVARL
ncbi:M23 family metallopeptidase [Leptospira fainei]|uniref:M23 family metallopeptidase n=1 Tax=Leptospira fainei TaxID=48782 RepID=UPI0009FDAF4C|nr:M23 family metallopeptidase [Leptospira fainei]